ncbi:hypothetical protein EVAR_45403_1 [Eumeta japonica]|uniref:Uncharacterized protein n=1 Tax=Eumeta variegata TaxID=151549 RepID=A0A4C1WRR3_EUMVA|nr:hypothetical protein EVAR_45403_1 [Eumeta japonica]
MNSEITANLTIAQAHGGPGGGRDGPNEPIGFCNAVMPPDNGRIIVSAIAIDDRPLPTSSCGERRLLFISAYQRHTALGLGPIKSILKMSNAISRRKETLAMQPNGQRSEVISFDSELDCAGRLLARLPNSPVRT